MTTRSLALVPPPEEAIREDESAVERRYERVRSCLSRIRALTLAQRVATERGVTIVELLGSRRHFHRLTRARFELWELLYTSAAPCIIELARIFEVNHATVLSGIKRHEKLLSEEHAR